MKLEFKTTFCNTSTIYETDINCNGMLSIGFADSSFTRPWLLSPTKKSTSFCSPHFLKFTQPRSCLTGFLFLRRSPVHFSVRSRSHLARSCTCTEFHCRSIVREHSSLTIPRFFFFFLVTSLTIRLLIDIMCFHYQNNHNIFNTMHLSITKCFGRLFRPSKGRSYKSF